MAELHDEGAEWLLVLTFIVRLIIIDPKISHGPEICGLQLRVQGLGSLGSLGFIRFRAGLTA
jgi:hypothetical protein